MSILEEIFANKREEVAVQQRIRPQNELLAILPDLPPARDFVSALQPKRNDSQGLPIPALIAEVKKQSPSKGLLAKYFDPLGLAGVYRENGASAISVLTDEKYFGGRLEYLVAIVQNSGKLPVLRKDFILAPYQIYEARVAGADAILLIAAMLPQEQLKDLHGLALSLGVTPLVEIHSLAEWERVAELQPVLVGINNRDLHTFKVDLTTTLDIRPAIPQEICVVAESGIHQRQDVLRVAQAGVQAVLVGEALVTAPDIAAQVRQLAQVGEMG